MGCAGGLKVPKQRVSIDRPWATYSYDKSYQYGEIEAGFYLLAFPQGEYSAEVMDWQVVIKTKSKVVVAVKNGTTELPHKGKAGVPVTQVEYSEHWPKVLPREVNVLVVHLEFRGDLFEGEPPTGAEATFQVKENSGLSYQLKSPIAVTAK